MKLSPLPANVDPSMAARSHCKDLKYVPALAAADERLAPTAIAHKATAFSRKGPTKTSKRKRPVQRRKLVRTSAPAISPLSCHNMGAPLKVLAPWLGAIMKPGAIDCGRVPSTDFCKWCQVPAGLENDLSMHALIGICTGQFAQSAAGMPTTDAAQLPTSGNIFEGPRITSAASQPLVPRMAELEQKAGEGMDSKVGPPPVLS